MDNLAGVAVLDEAATEPAEVRPGDLALLGRLTGIAEYVLGPAPIAGALDRIRARAFRINAYMWLVIKRMQQDLVPGLRVVSARGGRFLLAGPARPTAEPILASFQRNLDEWAFRQLRGEVQVYLAAARCETGGLPMEALESKLAARRLRPMEGALLQGAYWNAAAFWNPATANGTDRCQSCGASDTIHGDLCFGCLEDQELGQVLSQARFASWTPENEGRVAIPGLGLTLGGAGEVDLRQGDWPLFRHTPAGSLEELRVIGCLSVEPDGDSERLGPLIELRFPNLYPILTGEGSLLVIGAWDQALNLAIELRHERGEEGLAGSLVLAHPWSRLNGVADRARQEARRVRSQGGDRLSILGCPVTWEETGGLAESAQRVALWLRQGRLTPEVLWGIAETRRQSGAGDGWRRGRAALAGQARRVADPEVREWIHRLAGRDDWPRFERVSRLALLASGQARQG